MVAIEHNGKIIKLVTQDELDARIAESERRIFDACELRMELDSLKAHLAKVEALMESRLDPERYHELKNLLIDAKKFEEMKNLLVTLSPQ